MACSAFYCIFAVENRMFDETANSHQHKNIGRDANNMVNIKQTIL